MVYISYKSLTCSFLQRLMFQGAPGVSVEWPAVLYPAPLPQYEGLKTNEPPKPAEPDAAVPGKVSGVRLPLFSVLCYNKTTIKCWFLLEMFCSKNKKRKSRGKGKKTGKEQSRGDDGEEDDVEVVPSPQKTGGREGGRGEGESSSKASTPSLYPAWKQNTSDSDFSDPEGTAQSKLRYWKYDHSCHHLFFLAAWNTPDDKTPILLFLLCLHCNAAALECLGKHLLVTYQGQNWLEFITIPSTSLSDWTMAVCVRGHCTVC